MENVMMKAGSFVAMIALGYLLKKLGVFRKEDFTVLSSIVLKITLPCAVITNFSQNRMDFTLLLLVPLGFACNWITIGAGWLSARLRGRGREEQAFRLINLSGYNVGCFAMPFVQNFLGPMGVVTACMFDAGNAVMCTGATSTVAEAVAGKGRSFTLGGFLKRLFSSVAMDTYLIMLVVSGLGLMLPRGILEFTGTVGAANSFAAMLMIGIGFELGGNRERFARIGKMVLARFGISCCLALLFYFCLPFPLEIRQVLVLLAFAPVSSACPAFTNMVDGDVALASAINSANIVVGLIAMTSLLVAMGLG